MAKPSKGDRTAQTPATDADHEQRSGELPQETTSNATDTPQPDADVGSGPADGSGTGEGSDSDPAQPAAAQAPGDAAGAGPAPLTGDQPAGATDADHEQQSGDEPAPLPDERVLVRFTGPWKNYSRGDITRLSPAEAEVVIKKTLAQAEPEQAEE